MKRILNRVAATALLVGLGVLGTFAHAEDEATRDEQPRRQRQCRCRESHVVVPDGEVSRSGRHGVEQGDRQSP